MPVNATIQFYEEAPPTSAVSGQTIQVTTLITNTGTLEEDFRLSMQIVGVGAAIFPVPLEVWSGAEELSVGEVYTARTVFTMPSYGVTLTCQSEWYDRTGQPAQWKKIGNTVSWNVALAGVSPQFPVGPSGAQPAGQPPIQVGLQIPTTAILIIAALGIGAYFLLRKK